MKQRVPIAVLLGLSLTVAAVLVIAQPGVDQPYDPNPVVKLGPDGTVSPWFSVLDDDVSFEKWWKTQQVGDASRPKLTFKVVRPVNQYESEAETYFGWLPVGSAFEAPWGGVWVKTAEAGQNAVRLDEWGSDEWQPDDEVRLIVSVRVQVTTYARE